MTRSYRFSTTGIRSAASLVLAVALVATAAPSVGAQTPTLPPPKILYACYGPLTGLVYRIKEPGLPQACFSALKGYEHIEFSWSDKGLQGDPGPAGAQGQPGPQGPKGDPGAAGGMVPIAVATSLWAGGCGAKSSNVTHCEVAYESANACTHYLQIPVYMSPLTHVAVASSSRGHISRVGFGLDIISVQFEEGCGDVFIVVYQP